MLVHTSGRTYCTAAELILQKVLLAGELEHNHAGDWNTDPQKRGDAPALTKFAGFRILKQTDANIVFQHFSLSNPGTFQILSVIFSLCLKGSSSLILGFAGFEHVGS